LPPDAAERLGIPADRFAREIGAILKASLGALAAAECQAVRVLVYHLFLEI
jgi:hypothetical protein